MKFREEKDYLGKVKIQKDKYYGIHTKRALKNFPISDYKIDSTFIKSFAYIKHAAALTNKEYGYLDSKLADSIVQACTEIENGKFHEQIVVDPFQGGAGTSTNMNFNEVIANRAIQLLILWIMLISINLPMMFFPVLFRLLFYLGCTIWKKRL
jgi:aspartate ammonia-lyase